jgi:hypothetical protein
VGFSALRELDQVVPLVRRVFAIRASDAASAAETVGTALCAKPLPQVLDNREHLSKAAATFVA